MAREERIALEVTADDEASRTLDRVAEKAEELERADPEVAVTADDDVSRVLEDVAAEARELARRDHEIALTARVGDLRAALATAEADLDRLKGAAGGADEAVGKIGDSADQSRSVMANMVGNASQDLGELGGIAGTAGVAVGQIAEYATEGNIAIKGLLTTAVPMLALGIAVKMISDNFADAKKEAEELKKTNRELAESLRAGDLEAAAKTITDGYSDLIEQAEAAGVSAQALTAYLTDQDATLEDLAGSSSASAEDLAALALNAAQAKDSFQDQNAALATNAARQSAVRGALGETADALTDAEEATKDLTAAYDVLTGRLDDEASYLSAQAAIDAVNDAMAEAMTATATYGAESEEAQDANRRLAEQMNASKRDVLDYAGAVAGLPEEQATEILTLVNEGDFVAAERRLAEIERTRTAHVNLEVVYGRNRPLGYPASAPWPPTGAATMAAPMTTNVTVNMPRGARGSDVVRSVERYARRNGGGR